MKKSTPMGHKDLGTVDVWDTVLRRRCHPDAAKLHVARLLLLRCPAEIARLFGDARSLLVLRLAVERDLARTARQDSACDDEYSHSEVMREWVARACGRQRGDDESLLAELSAAELMHEAFACYVDADAARTLRLWRSFCRRLVFLSDFYLPADTLGLLLRQKPLGVAFDGGFTSADQRVNKRSGRLFRRVQELEGVGPGQHRHLGDNRLSDVVVPRALGIEAHRHRNRVQERLRRQRLQDFTAPRKHIERLDRECRRRPGGESSERRIRDFAAMAAPLFAGFALFVSERARRDRVERLFFLAREGEFLLKVFDALIGVYPALAATLPPAQLLEVSRLSTFGPSLGLADQQGLEAGLQLLWKGFPDQSLIALASSLGVDTDSWRQAAARHGIDPDQVISNISADARIRGLLRDARLREPLVERLNLRRRDLECYLLQSGLAKCSHVGIVDIGWRGSMQDNLSRLLPHQRSVGYYLGLQSPLYPEPANTRRQAYGESPDRSGDLEASGLNLFAHLPTLELLCTSSLGSVAGYEPLSGGVVPVREPMRPSQQQWYDEYAAPWQSAVIEGVRQWAQGIHDQALGSEDLRDLALKRWSRMVNRPPTWLRQALSNVEHDERFGRGRVAPMPAPQHKWRRLLSF